MKNIRFKPASIALFTAAGLCLTSAANAELIFTFEAAVGGTNVTVSGSGDYPNGSVRGNGSTSTVTFDENLFQATFDQAIATDNLVFDADSSTHIDLVRSSGGASFTFSFDENLNNSTNTWSASGTFFINGLTFADTFIGGKNLLATGGGTDSSDFGGVRVITGPSPGTVPEPSGMFLAMFALFPLLASRRRRRG